MRTWTKQLSIGLGALLTSGIAHAFPPQCMQVCSCEKACTTVCWEGTTPSSCDNGWSCECALPGPTSLASDAVSVPQDAFQEVCTADDDQPGALDGSGDASS